MIGPQNCRHLTTQSKNITVYWYFQTIAIEIATKSKLQFPHYIQLIEDSFSIQNWWLFFF